MQLFAGGVVGVLPGFREGYHGHSWPTPLQPSKYGRPPERTCVDVRVWQKLDKQMRFDGNSLQTLPSIIPFYEHILI